MTKTDHNEPGNPEADIVRVIKPAHVGQAARAGERAREGHEGHEGDDDGAGTGGAAADAGPWSRGQTYEARQCGQTADKPLSREESRPTFLRVADDPVGGQLPHECHRWCEVL